MRMEIRYGRRLIILLGMLYSMAYASHQMVHMQQQVFAIAGEVTSSLRENQIKAVGIGIIV